MIRQVVVVSVVAWIGVPTAAVPHAFAEPALTFVLQAFAAEEHASKKRGHLIFRTGHTETRYSFERVLPDRLHMYSGDADREQELYIIGDQMYQKTATGWIKTRAAPRLSTPSSVVGLFENRLENIREQNPISVDGAEQRVFEGTISWFAGRNRNQGEIRILIEATSALPHLLTFNGLCGTTECAFEYAITYDPGISIEAPLP